VRHCSWPKIATKENKEEKKTNAKSALPEREIPCKSASAVTVIFVFGSP